MSEPEPYPIGAVIAHEEMNEILSNVSISFLEELYKTRINYLKIGSQIWKHKDDGTWERVE